MQPQQPVNVGGKYRWNLVIAGQDVLFWRGSIKRLDLQTTYRYRAETFRVRFYRIALQSYVVTRSNRIWVSHSGTSNLKLLEMFNHFDLHRIHVSREPVGLLASCILCELHIHIPTKSLNRKVWACIVQPQRPVKFGGKYRWNLVIAGQDVLFWRGSIKRLDLQTTCRYRAETSRVCSYRIELQSCVVTRSNLIRVSHSGTLNLKLLEMFNHFDLHRIPVSREPVGLEASYILCELHIHIPTKSLNRKVWACIVQPQRPVKFGGKYRWNLVIAGQDVLFWRGSIKRLDLQTTCRYRAETSRVCSYRIELQSCVVTRSNLIRVNHSGTSKSKLLEIFKHFWPASEPCK